MIIRCPDYFDRPFYIGITVKHIDTLEDLNKKKLKAALYFGSFTMGLFDEKYIRNQSFFYV